MPYEIAFAMRVDVADPDAFLNECCRGGDVVTEQLRPMIRVQYESVQTNQKDWGWYIGVLDKRMLSSNPKERTRSAQAMEPPRLSGCRSVRGILLRVGMRRGKKASC